MKTPISIIVIIVSIVIYSCINNREPVQLKSGIWRAELKLDENDTSIILPFNFNVSENSPGTYILEIINADERIKIEEINIKNDSISIKLPVFESEIKAVIKGNTLIGKWFNYAKGNDYSIPFYAVHGVEDRFISTNDAASNFLIGGRWETIFSPNTSNTSKAIGEFVQDGNKLTGTFLTETGDYRYLEGIISGNEIYLSCFDGAHAFLFKAHLETDSILEGWFWSGKHWKEPWRAVKNENAQLRHPDSLTFLKEGYTTLEFSFPSSYDHLISLNDEKYKNKVVIVQIMGTWCPNCLDETELFAELFNKYNPKGLEIIALAYEKTDDIEKAKDRIRYYKELLGVNYDFLVAGNADKEKASATLPMLNGIMSFPTTIYIDRKGNVRKIHTGFTGPGTGEHYINFVNEITEFIEELLKE